MLIRNTFPLTLILYTCGLKYSWCLNAEEAKTLAEKGSLGQFLINYGRKVHVEAPVVSQFLYIKKKL
jgi:hypothetical protein